MSYLYVVCREEKRGRKKVGEMFKFLGKEPICLTCVMFSLLPGSVKSFLRDLTVVPNLLKHTYMRRFLSYVCMCMCITECLEERP